jgi:hypothetical protein
VSIAQIAPAISATIPYINKAIMVPSDRAVVAFSRLENIMLTSNEGGHDAFFAEDEKLYEDKPCLRKMKMQTPTGWALIRIMCGYPAYLAIDEWLAENAIGEFRRVNWSEGGCSYSQGIMMEQEMDIILFKIRFGGLEL